MLDRLEMWRMWRVTWLITVFHEAALAMISTWLVDFPFLFFLFTFSLLFFLVCFKARLHNSEKYLLSSWCPSVCSYVCMYKLGSHWMDFHEILYWEYLWKSVKVFQMWLKFGNSDGHFTWLPEYIYLLPAALCRHKVLSSKEIVSGCYGNEV